MIAHTLAQLPNWVPAAASAVALGASITACLSPHRSSEWAWLAVAAVLTMAGLAVAQVAR